MSELSRKMFLAETAAVREHLAEQAQQATAEADPAVSSAGQAPATNHTAAPAVWIDGHPQLEAIAAAVWEQCGRSDSGTCVEDDPRNIAVAALAAVLPAPTARDCPPDCPCHRVCIGERQSKPTTPTDPAATLRWAADEAEKVALRLRMKHDVGAANGAYEVMEELRRLADETPEGDPACAHCGGNHAWDNCEAYTALVAAETPATNDEPAAGARQDGDQT